MISPMATSRRKAMLFFSARNWSIALPRSIALSHSMDSGSSTMKAAPISVPITEPTPPIMIIARKMIDRSMPNPSFETT